MLDERQRRAAAAAALVLGATLLDVAAIAFTFVIVRTLVDPVGATHLPVIAVLYRHGLLGALRWLPVSVSLLYFAFIVAKNAYGVAMTWYQERLFARVAASIGGVLLASYLHASWNVMASRKAAEMMNVADVAGGAALTSVFRLSDAGERTFGAEQRCSPCCCGWRRCRHWCPSLCSARSSPSSSAASAPASRSWAVSVRLANERVQFVPQCLESGREIRIAGRIGGFVTRFGELRLREGRALQSIARPPEHSAFPVRAGAVRRDDHRGGFHHADVSGQQCCAADAQDLRGCGLPADAVRQPFALGRRDAPWLLPTP